MSRVGLLVVVVLLLAGCGRGDSEIVQQISDPNEAVHRDPAVARYRDGLGAFTNGSTSETYTYKVTRKGVN